MFKSMKSRMVGVAIIPLAVALYFMANSVYTKWGTLQEMSRVATLTDLAGHITAYVHETQKERGLTAGFMGSKGTSKFLSKCTKNLLTQKIRMVKKMLWLHGQSNRKLKKRYCLKTKRNKIWLLG